MGAGEQIYEVEVELQQDGTLKDLQALDEILLTRGLQPESRSKFERAAFSPAYIVSKQ